MLCNVVDAAIQARGAGGVSDGLGRAYAEARGLRIVHRDQIGQLELRKHA